MTKLVWGDIGSPSKVFTNDEDSGEHAMMGTFFHEVMEYHALQKIKEVNISLEELHVEMDAKLEKVNKDKLKWKTFDEWEATLHEQLEWAYNASSMAYKHFIDVEWTFELDSLMEGVEMPVTGTVDRIVGNMKDKDVHLEDWKTGKTYTRKDLESNIQATMYAIAFYKSFGFMPKTFTFYFSKGKKVKTIHLTPDFMSRGMQRILAVWYGISNGNWEPNDKNRYFCNNFCGVKKECPKFAKRQVPGWEGVK